MKKVLYIFMAALLLAGCDKIEDAGNGYVIYSGASGEWVETQEGVSDHSQRVFVEKYTGTHCTNCPKADEAIEQLHKTYGDKLIAVSVYDSSNYASPYPNNLDLRTADGNVWSKYFGIRSIGYPNCLLNRNKNGEGNYEIINPTSGMGNKIDAILAQQTPVAMEVQLAGIEGSQVMADVFVEFLQDVNEPLSLTLLVMEDGLVSEQMLPMDSEIESDPNYVHDHVLRDVVTDPWGDAMNIEGQQGHSYRARYAFPLNSEYKLNNCHIVAFVSNQNSRVVLNIAECKLHE